MYNANLFSSSHFIWGSRFFARSFIINRLEIWGQFTDKICSNLSAYFASTNAKTGTIQRRLAWPLQQDACKFMKGSISTPHPHRPPWHCLSLVFVVLLPLIYSLLFLGCLLPPPFPPFVSDPWGVGFAQSFSPSHSTPLQKKVGVAEMCGSLCMVE